MDRKPAWAIALAALLITLALVCVLLSSGCPSKTGTGGVAANQVGPKAIVAPPVAAQQNAEELVQLPGNAEAPGATPVTSGAPSPAGAPAQGPATVPKSGPAAPPAPAPAATPPQGPPAGTKAAGPGKAPGTPGAPGAKSGPPGVATPGRLGAGKAAPVKLTGELARIAEKRKALKSYKTFAIVRGRQMGSRYVKQEDGKVVAMRVELGPSAGWILTRYDKGETYRYDPKEKVVTRFAAGNRAWGGLGVDRGTLDLERLMRLPTPPKITSEKLDGIDCWRVDITRTRGSSTSWFDKRYGLERQTKLGDSIVKHKVEQVNAVPDSMFELPKDVKIVDAPPGQSPWPGAGAGKRGGGGPQGGAAAPKAPKGS